ncbi:nucleotidyltransferase domain-containing protein [Candidatus Woesearchaeota archaeon]|nr:nucleotidyltransferase domain-containing protein [Candidatus Woesearchaeota archaeon]
MDISGIVIDWARDHKEITAVILGGSRAKGTAVSTSDYDFGVQLEQDPTPDLINRLTKDFPLQSVSEARIFPELERHFVLGGKGFKTPEGIDVTLGFVNVAFLLHAFKENLHYPVIDQQLEFLKVAKVLYDPTGIVADLQKKEFPDWATKKLIQDSIGLALWNADKCQKATKGRAKFTAALLKFDALWCCSKAIAAINRIPLVYKYGYDDFKVVAAAQGKRFLAPENFFQDLEACGMSDSAEMLTQFVNKVKAITETR